MSAQTKHIPHHTRTKTPHTNPSNIPSIRLISATPSASGSAAGSSETSCVENQRALEDAWAAIASAPVPSSSSSTSQPSTNGIGLPLAPKTDGATGVGGRLRTTSKKLIPKKSKLSLSGLSTLAAGSRERARAKDFSDVVRRVGADMSAEGGFEIYVDPEVSDEGVGGEGEVLVVNLRKGGKKRGGLEGVGWGAREVGNLPRGTGGEQGGKAKEGGENGKGKEGGLKVKTEEGGKWWSIGRGRKDSKEEKREKENVKMSYKPIEYIHDPNPRSKTPEPFQNSTRSRFNSLGAVGLLKSHSTGTDTVRASTPAPSSTGPVKFADDTPASTIGRSTPTLSMATMRSTTPTPTMRSVTPTLTRSVTPTAGGLLAPPGGVPGQGQGQGLLGVPGQANGQGQGQQGSIALRAMRSVRSLARIGSWAQLKNMPAPGDDEVENATSVAVKEKKEKKEKGTIREKKGKENVLAGVGEEGAKKEKKKKSLKVKKEKAKEKEEKVATIRLSSSSFEIGALTSSPGPAPASSSSSPVTETYAADAQTLGPKKHSILGLGLPSSMRLPSIGARVASTASSITPSIIGAPQRLSAELTNTSRMRTPTNSFGSVGPIVIAGAQGQQRRASIVSSTGSSLRPLSVGSTATGMSRASSRSSGGSVRWDEEGLESVREQRNKEREARRASDEIEDEKEKERGEKTERRTSGGSKHSAEGRRRTSIKAVFPEYPILTIEEATLDGHSAVPDSPLSRASVGGDEEKAMETPVKKARARPLSEQLLGKSRPKPMHSEDGDEGVLSILDAATNDLALLINNLDLQATPSTPGDRSPLRPFDLTPSGSSSPSTATNSASNTANGKPKSATLGRMTTFMAAAESPLKSARKVSKGPLQLQTMSSVSSLRPYAQSRGYTKPSSGGLMPAAMIIESPPSTIGRNGTIRAASNANANTTGNANANAAMIAKQIAPWATLMQGLSPVKEKVKAINAKSSSPSPSIPTPTKSLASSTSSKLSHAFRPGHKRTMTPAREPEPEVVFQPLRPARSRGAVQAQVVFDEDEEDKSIEEPQTQTMSNAARSSTFGRTSKLHLTSSLPANDDTTDDFGAPLPPTTTGRLTPVFTRLASDLNAGLHPPADPANANGGGNNRLSTASTASYLSVSALRPLRPQSHSRSPRSTLSPASSRGGSVASYASRLSTGANPLAASLSAREKRRVLGMSGTLGGSDVSAYHAQEDEEDDEHSDVPEELREILAYSDREDTGVIGRGAWGEDADEEVDAMDVDDLEVEVGRNAPPSAGPPSLPLPTPTLAFELGFDDDLTHADLHLDDLDPTTNTHTPSIDFDWTGELRALNQSGASDRRSFVEQLEHAFKTPAKGLGLDLWVGGMLGVPGAVGGGGAPPVPKMPVGLMQEKMRMGVETKMSQAAGVAESWRLAVEAETSTSSMGLDDDEEEERRAAYEYDSGAFSGVIQEGGESSAMEDQWSGSMLRDVEMPSALESQSQTQSQSQSQSQSQALSSSQNQTRFDLFPSQSGERLTSVRAPSPLNDTTGEDSIFNKSTSSTNSRSEGELDTSFRFGGLPDSLRKETAAPSANANANAKGKPLTLSDIIPPPAHARRLSMAMDVDVEGEGEEQCDEEEDLNRSQSDSYSSTWDNSSVIRDIYEHLMNPQSARLAVAAAKAAAATSGPPKEALPGLPAAPQVPAPAQVQGQAQVQVPVRQQQQARGGHREEAAKRRSIYKAPSRPTSGISFTGLGDSFEEARRNFEFASDRPAFYPPSNNASYNTSFASQSYASYSYVSSRSHGTTRRTGTGTGARYTHGHGRMESVFSIASVESYGRVINGGKPDPFDFDMMPSLRERPSSETMSAVGSLGDFEDTFAFRREEMMLGGHGGVPGSIRGFSFGGPGAAGGLRLRQRVESDASTFSFHAPAAPINTSRAAHHHHRRRESNMSVASLAPPISLYNRSFPHNHRRTDSASSAGSFYGHHSRSHSRGVVGNGIHAWARHRRDMSDSSMGSEFSAGYVANLGRPGVGDKMFGAGDRDSSYSYSERFDRPGVGEKMFDGPSVGGADLGPLTSIMASPADSFAFDEEDIAMPRGVQQQPGQESMLAYDSIMDGDPRYEDSDSIFGQITRAGIIGPGIGMGEASRDSVASEEVFGLFSADYAREEGGVRLQPPVIQSRRWSVDNTGVLGMESGRSDEDTMLSMLGGGQEPIRRHSILESPCPRVEKRKFSAVASQRLFNGKDASDHYESPTKARIVEKPSLASASSFQFGGDRMIKAQRGLLERQSLEDSCLVADGEELARTFFTAPVFTRPGPTTRSRSSTCTTSSSGSGSGADTPPLSSSTGGETPPLLHHSDASSLSGGSQSSIDLAHLEYALSHATSPNSSVLRRQRSARTRARARGAGHRRRYSAQAMSRSSVYETIDEDGELAGSQQSSPSHTGHLSAVSKKSSPTTTMSMTTRQAVFVVDSDTASFDDHSQGLEESVWSDEKGIMALRKYYALRDEAQNTVSESRRMWSDTPFSLFAIQTFEAPAEPAGMQALLEYSVQNYGPLPSELRPRRIRSRTSSRPSPYPHARNSKATMSPDQTRTSKASTASTAVFHTRTAKSTVDSMNSNNRTPGILQPKSVLTNRNSAAPSLKEIKPFLPIVLGNNNAIAKNVVEPKRENAFGLAPDARPRVPSGARRTALGWAKRSTGKSSTDQKENQPQAASGLVMTPGDNLRLNRPRPRGRPTPAGRTPALQNRAIRL